MQSTRLTYRPLDYSDAARIAELAGDWDVARMTARIPHPYSLVQAHHWIGSLEPGEFVRIVEFGGRLIGAVGYVPSPDRSVEIGYWIGRPWWGQGFATEAAEALIAHCFAAGEIPRLTCCHFIDNPASERIIRKLGFRLTGTCSAWCEARGEQVATLRYQRRRPILMRPLLKGPDFVRPILERLRGRAA
ncbi:MAG: GNAT family N-acetyltransferase [Hyphomicrobium sp.]